MNRNEDAPRTPMNHARATHHAYTLRLAQVSDTEQWRATLYCAHTGERWRFADLDRLCAFLRQIGDGAGCADPPDVEQDAEMGGA